MTEDDMKEALKEALKEWLEEKYAAVGKWSIGLFAAAALSAIVYFILAAQGWHRG